MRDLLKIAEKYFDSSEISYVSSNNDSVSFADGKLKDIESGLRSVISFRGIKNNTLGTSYTRNLIDKEKFIENAAESLKGSVKAEYDFPETKGLAALNNYEDSISKLENQALVDEIKRVTDILKSKVTGQIDIYAGKGIVEYGIINSKGTELKNKVSSYYLAPSIVFPGTSARVSKQLVDKKFVSYKDEDIDFIVDLYKKAEKEVKFESGKMQVMFLPSSIYSLLWRINSAANAKNIYEKTSPLINKLGEKIFSEKLTLINDPMADVFVTQRNFDDEGVATKNLPIIEKGVLKNYYNDLKYAALMNQEPTGTGFGGAPSLSALYFEPGNMSFNEMIKSMKKGVIIGGALGAHSGNILNGDLSIGVAPGYYVENGEIVGRVKNTMVAGNVYDFMKNIEEVENELHTAFGGKAPAILFNDMNVASQ